MQQLTINKPVSQVFDDLKVCVIIPTYNNEATVATVIKDVQAYTQNIIVVNDGATDGTAVLLQQFGNSITLVAYTPNQGKGFALRSGFAKAIELSYRYAITIDSDGQHFASDLPLFIQALQSEGSSLVMGARSMATADNVPGKSSFGNKFSNFWYRVETGITLPDTQTGYRLYPLQPISRMRFFTKKYEFEIEVIVRLAWEGVKVVSVPITVYYPPAGERISHFRPFKDFTRISIVNTVLVTICFFYIWPRNFFRRFYKNKNWKQEVKNLFYNPAETTIAKANAVALGIFIGIIPIWGFQILAAIALAHLLRLNKALVLLAAHISFPPLLPFIIYLSYEAGKYWMGPKAVSFSLKNGFHFDKIWANVAQYLYGSITLAIAGAVAAWLLTYVFLTVWQRTKNNLAK